VEGQRSWLLGEDSNSAQHESDLNDSQWSQPADNKEDWHSAAFIHPKNEPLLGKAFGALARCWRNIANGLIDPAVGQFLKETKVRDKRFGRTFSAPKAGALPGRATPRLSRL